MKRFFFGVLLFLLITGCTKQQFNERYLVVSEVSAEGKFVEKGDFVKISALGFYVYRADSSFSFPVVIAENRLLIQTRDKKLLFETLKNSDSVLVLNELYSSSPLRIKLKIINNKN